MLHEFSASPVPPIDLVGSEVGGVIMTVVWVSLMALAFVWAIYMFARRRNPLPLLMVIGGIITFPIEAMLDSLVNLWYATNLPVPVLTSFGVQLPLFVVPAYAILGGVGGYGSYYLFKRGSTTRHLLAAWGALMLADVLLEVPAINADLFAYYGNQPFLLLGYPLWEAFSASSAILMIGYALYWVDQRTEGWGKLFAIFCAPVAVGASYAADGWPLYVALNSDASPVVTWLLGALAIAFAVGSGWYIISTVATDGRPVFRTPVTPQVNPERLVASR